MKRFINDPTIDRLLAIHFLCCVTGRECEDCLWHCPSYPLCPATWHYDTADGLSRRLHVCGLDIAEVVLYFLLVLARFEAEE